MARREGTSPDKVRTRRGNPATQAAQPSQLPGNWADNCQATEYQGDASGDGKRRGCPKEAQPPAVPLPPTAQMAAQTAGIKTVKTFQRESISNGNCSASGALSTPSHSEAFWFCGYASQSRKRPTAALDGASQKPCCLQSPAFLPRAEAALAPWWRAAARTVPT